jgi:hypothetical protein
MKKIVLALTLLTFTVTSRSQIALEYNYPASTGLTELAISGYKYFQMDVVNSKCEIYNMDHSLWKTVSLDVPNGMYLYDIRFVSESLFNTDSKVELAYIYYSYDTTLYYYTYYCKVIDETGMELLSIPGCSFLDVRSVGAEGYKMLAYVYDYSIISWTVNTHVYSLPGILPNSGVEVEGREGNRRPFPNPAASILTISYDLPDGTKAARLELMSASGQLVRDYSIDQNKHELLIPTSGLPSGTYIYQIRSNERVVDSGKLIFR